MCSHIKGVNSFPLSDGGEGFLDILSSGETLEWQELTVQDPYGNSLKTQYALLGNLAFVEAAKVIGYEGRPKSSILERNSFGLGQSIKHALTAGARQVLVAGGGTGVHDGGVGLLQALGARFVNNHGQELPWSRFEAVVSYEAPTAFEGQVKVLCDVQSTFRESLKLYAPNKGATEEELQQLRQRFEKLLTFYGEETAASGVGGGISHALASQVGAELVSGFDFLSKKFDIEKKVQEAEHVVTGEGCVDASSLHGKVVSGVAALAHKHGKPCTVICGSWDGETQPPGVSQIISLNERFGENREAAATASRIQDLIKEISL